MYSLKIRTDKVSKFFEEKIFTVLQAEKKCYFCVSALDYTRWVAKRFDYTRWVAKRLRDFAGGYNLLFVQFCAL
eukprot:UN00169